jgi:protein-disulfide isomerase
VLTGVAALAALAVVALIWLAQADVSPERPALATDGNVKGNVAAPVTIEEWGDFQCPACRQWAQGPGRELERPLLQAGQAKLVFRHLAFLGNESVEAAVAGECARDQGRFWDYHDTLFSRQGGENRGTFSRDNLKQYAADIGLDTAAFNACVDSERYRDRVLADVAEGDRQGVRSTPTVFVNGRKIENPFDVVAIQQAVTAAESGG